MRASSRRTSTEASSSVHMSVISCRRNTASPRSGERTKVPLPWVVVTSPRSRRMLTARRMVDGADAEHWPAVGARWGVGRRAGRRRPRSARRWCWLYGDRRARRRPWRPRGRAGPGSTCPRIRRCSAGSVPRSRPDLVASCQFNYINIGYEHRRGKRSGGKSSAKRDTGQRKPSLCWFFVTKRARNGEHEERHRDRARSQDGPGH